MRRQTFDTAKDSQGNHQQNLTYSPQQVVHQIQMQCLDSNRNQLQDKTFDIQITTCNCKRQQSFVIQFFETIHNIKHELHQSNAIIEQKSMQTISYSYKQQIYIQEIEQEIQQIMSQSMSKEVQKSLEQIQKYLQIIYHINLAVYNSNWLNSLSMVGAAAHLQNINLPQLIKQICHLFDRDLQKSQNIIQVKISRQDDKLVFNDYQKLKNLLTYIISAININSKQNIVIITISSYNEKVLKLTFNNSNLQFDQDLLKFTPTVSPEDKDSDISAEQERFLFVTDLQQIYDLVGQVGPDKKIDFETEGLHSNNISIKIFKNLEKTRVTLPHITHHQKKKNFMPINIIFECRESQGHDTITQIDEEQQE